MKFNFAIGIPTVNRADLLKLCLTDLAFYCPDIKIYVIDNGDQGIDDTDNISVSRPGKNIGVAASWNRLCSSIFNNHDVAVLMNDDISWQKKQQEIQEYLDNNEDIHFLSTSRHLCLFAIRKKVYTLVGAFDEKFYPAYFEDNDYAYRMKLKGFRPITSSFFDPGVYRNSMSMKRDAELGAGFMKNREYYIEKWGGLPGQEVFTRPFNVTGL